MVDEIEDPREVPWHPRHARGVLGHDQATSHFYKSFEAGKPHHAWLLAGAKGIGKATLAYNLAGHVLGKKNSAQSTRWIAARSHPDLYVLERKLGDTKPRKLKTEISVEDARGLSDFFSHTSSGGWRVGIVDAADDLNSESANALLKLVEEPPAKCILLLISHKPGRLLRTLKSRCMRLPLQPLLPAETLDILKELPLESKPPREELEFAASLSSGSPGLALALLTSEGAKAFNIFLKTKKFIASDIIAIGNRFGGRGVTLDDLNIFFDLLLDWLAGQAASKNSVKLATVHGKIAENIRITNAFNLDKRQAVIVAVSLVQEALKAA